MSKVIDYKLHMLVRPHAVLATAYGKPPQKKAHVIVELTDESGNVGYGEATPLPDFTGEIAAVVMEILKEVLLPEVLNLDSMDLTAVHERMEHAIAENYAAKSAVDCAMYDLSAKALGIPLYKLLGGRHNKTVKINRHIGIMDDLSAQALAEKYMEQGFFSIKMKVGSEPSEDARRVRAVRKAAGKQASIRIDANGGFTETQARQFIRLTENCGIEFYEQLLPKWDLKGLARLKQECGIPVLLDETVNSVRDAARCAESGAADAFTIKLCKCGGLYPALGIAKVAAAYGIEAVIASTYDTHIGCSACLHLASALPNVRHGCDLTTFATQPVQARTCHVLNKMELSVGDGPGIGVFSMNDFILRSAGKGEDNDGLTGHF